MTNKTFKDYFSRQSADYKHFRPVYPDNLYRFLAEASPGNEYAWDCATGSGQAALALSKYFKHVIATDASSNQLAHAMPAPNIHYQHARAEQTPIADQSIDLITVAQALHWFDIDAFYVEVQRVLKDGGVIAIWSYNLLSISPDIDQIIHRLYAEILGDYWPAERRLIENAYRDVRFPFQNIEHPDFTMKAQWTLHDLTGYLQTWSAVQNYMVTNNINPLQHILSTLMSAWGKVETLKTIEWPLHLMVGRHHN